MTHRSWILAGAVLVVLATTAPADASTKWRELNTVREGRASCIQVEDSRREYRALTDDEAVVLHVRGPRRLRILTRVLPDAGRDGPYEYELGLFVDGAEIDTKRYAVTAAASAVLCADPDAPVGALRKTYVRIPDGLHEVIVRVGAAEHEAVALRVFQESRRRREERVSLSPESYAEVLTLQFESGSRSSYYAFTAEKPLTFRVTGPTSVDLWTRLDFDHTMNGLQTYVLDVLVDGVSTGLRHYDVDKLDAAAYVERDDVLPGERKSLRLRLDKGRHRVEVRCVRPAGCCVSAKIWLPAEDLR